uniref:Uncharacterized protein n=1 Tax=Zonotrichia albicollis TaxID=44394 RepID=A0A8D2N6P1_ZONAL
SSSESCRTWRSIQFILKYSAAVFGLKQMQVLEMSPERESCLRYRMELLPQEIGRLRNLTCLYVDSNNLKKIPAEIGTLSCLERLTLSNNSLSSLPAEMGALQRLQSLHLANNRLTELPEPLCQLRSLTFLDVSDNEIDTIPSSIQHPEKLETLLLLFNSLESLPEDFCLLRNLHTLWLGNNHLQSLPFPLSLSLGKCSELLKNEYANFLQGNILKIPVIIIKGFISVTLWKFAETPFCFILLSLPPIINVFLPPLFNFALRGCFLSSHSLINPFLCPLCSFVSFLEGRAESGLVGAEHVLTAFREKGRKAERLIHRPLILLFSVLLFSSPYSKDQHKEI